MKKTFYIVVIFILCFCATPSLWAECRIDNISLEKDSAFTKLVIHADAPFEYKHSTVEASDDKPYRIVIDIEEAVHALPQNNFFDIPEGTITAIRTSQFAADPKRIVRIVMDVRNPIVYRTEREKENQLCVIISTPQDKSFPFWAADMTPFKEGESKLAQASQTKEPQQEQPGPAEIGQVNQVQIKEDKEEAAGGKVIKESDKTTRAEVALKTVVTQEEKTSGVKERKKVEEVKPEVESESKPEAVPEVESSTPETSKVAQLKERAEKEAEAIKSQAEKIKPRGEVIEAVYKRKVVTYSSDGRKDPFTPVGEKINVEFGEAPQPSYESLRLVGILKDASGNMALMEDGEGYGYIMRLGDKVKNGEVIYVGDDRVLFQITEYGWSKTVAIELSKEK